MKGRIKENDLYIFFEAIEQLEPQSVLDIGLLLKRAGSVSRKAMNCKIPEEIKLDGIDFTTEASFPALKNVYNDITDIRTFLGLISISKYDCAILIGIEGFQIRELLPELLQKIQGCSKYLLTDHSVAKQSEIECKMIDLRIEEDLYYLFDFGE